MSDDNARMAESFENLVQRHGGDAAVRGGDNVTLPPTLVSPPEVQNRMSLSSSSSPPQASSSTPSASSKASSPRRKRQKHIKELCLETIHHGLGNLTKDCNGVVNTHRAYHPVIQEFNQYCDLVHKLLPPSQRYQITPPKVLNFLMYVAFRKQKKRGKKGKKGGKKGKQDHNDDDDDDDDDDDYDDNDDDNDNDNGVAVKFSVPDWYRIINAFEDMADWKSIPDLDPSDGGVGWNVINTAKSALIKEFLDQKERMINMHTQEELITESVKAIMKYVQLRRPRANRLNYKEKIDHNSSPLISVKDIGVIENGFFEGAYNTKNSRNDRRLTFSSLRNRYIFLHTCHGVLRGESLFNGELSDIFGLEWQRENKDPHPFFISILQLDRGKTNNGLKLFGRCGRHINPNMCSVGAQGFYFMH